MTCRIIWAFLLSSLAWPMPGGLVYGTGSKVSTLLRQPKLKTTQFSVHFCDAETGKTVYSHQSDLVLAPASNMKILTTAGALDLLGSDFTYKTTFGLLGKNLVILGGGDPLLGDSLMAEERGEDIYGVFERVYEQLASRELDTIEGDLLIDDTFFDDERFHRSWPIDQANNWYAAQVSALNFNTNCLDVAVGPAAQPGKLAWYQIVPDTSYVEMTNKCKTVKGKTTAWAGREMGTNDITLRGNCGGKATFNVTLERPSAFFGFVLAEYLLKRGVSIEGKLVIKRLRDVNGHFPGGLEVLWVHQTPLMEVLTRCNQRSLNLAAECLFKTMGAYYQLRPGQLCKQGSWSTGREAMKGFLGGLGLKNKGYVIDDGSGLSKRNRVSARCLTTVLCAMRKSGDGKVFRESLATPEVGTLHKGRRFRETCYTGRLFAKTGYISGAWALSGYCQDGQGRWLAFSVLANNRSGGSVRSVVDLIVKEMMK